MNAVRITLEIVSNETNKITFSFLFFFLFSFLCVVMSRKHEGKWLVVILLVFLG